MVELHSSAQPELADDCIPALIRTAVDELRARFVGQRLPVLRWNKSYVAVPLTVEVELPGRGPVGGVDIRKQEPILLLFNEAQFPYIAPLVYSDRRDFPKSTFPHVNVTGPGLPAWFCLHRGWIDAWFAEHTVCDLVERARGWLRDAARNRLVPEGDGFEPTRASGTLGTFVYPPDAMERQVAAGLATGGDARRCFILFEMLDDEARAEIGLEGYSVRLDRFVIEEAVEDYRGLAAAFNTLAKHPENKGGFRSRQFGILLWVAEGEVTDRHFGELPVTLGSLLEWASNLGLPMAQALTAYLADDLQCFAGVPITLAVRRPRAMLGSDSDLEFLNFLVIAGGEHRPKDGAWDWDAAVWFSDHRTPLTPAFARRLSAMEPAEAAAPTVVFGAGALGSKVAMHLAREGSLDLKIVDGAKLAPHNLVRHALGGRAIGLSKAEAVKDELQKLYPGQGAFQLEGIAKSAIPCLQEPGFFDDYRKPRRHDRVEHRVQRHPRCAASRDAARPSRGDRTPRAPRAPVHRGRRPQPADRRPPDGRLRLGSR